MPVPPFKLASALKSGLAPLYLVSGDETLLVEECCDDILARARKDGFAERDVVHVDANYDWQMLREQTGSLSLFSERRIYDLRVPPKQLGRPAADALGDYLSRATDDTLVLIRSGRLDPGQRKSAWFKAIDKAAVVVLVWPISAAELPKWLDARCRRVGLQLDRDALTFLSARVEGNLLAAAQEIEKLWLLAGKGQVDVDTVKAAVIDASHYDSFDAVDAAMAQQSRRLRHILKVLRQEDVAPLAVLGALTSQLGRLRDGNARGLPPERARVVASASARLSGADLDELLQLAMVVDQQVKGMCDGDTWQTLETMFLLLAGATGLRPMARQLHHLRRDA